MKPKGEWTVLSRKDIGLLVVIGVLFAVLSFHVGLYWGMQWGLTNAPTAKKVEEKPQRKVYTAESTQPEGWAKEKQVPQDLKESFVKSKQNALVESQLRSENKTEFGKSIADSKAYFEKKKLEWGEAPKEAFAPERNLASEDAESEEPKVDASLSSLFERSPAAVKAFEPTVGHFTIQVASYATEDEAVARVKQMVSNGVSEAYYKSAKKGKDIWYQVLVGSYKDKTWAQKIGDRLKRRSVASDYFVKKVH